MEKIEKKMDQITNDISEKINDFIQEKRNVENEQLKKYIQDLQIDTKLSEEEINEISFEMERLRLRIRNEVVHNSKIQILTMRIGLTSLIVSAIASALMVSPNLAFPIAFFGGVSAFLGFFYDTIISNKLLKESKKITKKIITKITNDIEINPVND